MKKKIIWLIAMLCAATMVFAGCSQQILDKTGTTREIKYDCFALIEPIGDGIYTYLCYDINTGVMYYIIDSLYRAGITPYYVFDGESMEIRVGHYPEDYNK